MRNPKTLRGLFATIRLAISGFVLSILLPAPALALDFFSHDFIKGGEEHLILNLGGVLDQFDTVVRLDGRGSRGDAVNLENNGLEANVSSFQASGTWRFWSRNRFDVMYYAAKRTGSHVTDRKFTIDGNEIDVDFTLAAEARDHFFLFDYRRSLIKKDKHEIAALIGIYGGEFEFDLSATGTEQGQTVTKSTAASTALPLPLIGASFDWYINPRWSASASLSGVKAKIGDVDGYILVAGASAAFMLVRHFGIGLTYQYSDLDVDVSKDSYNGNLRWSVNSISAYGRFEF